MVVELVVLIAAMLIVPVFLCFLNVIDLSCTRKNFFVHLCWEATFS